MPSRIQRLWTFLFYLKWGRKHLVEELLSVGASLMAKPANEVDRDGSGRREAGGEGRGGASGGSASSSETLPLMKVWKRGEGSTHLQRDQREHKGPRCGDR